jgi:hypothetical protein
VHGKAFVMAWGLVGTAALHPVAAQTSSVQTSEQARAARRQLQQRNELEQLRYQIATMERVLENAVEHGASRWRDRLQSVMPSQALLLDAARARGYRLEGYGVFFDVEVPSLSFETTLFSAMRTLDRNGLALQAALKQMREHVKAANDAGLEQALKRIELQVAPIVSVTTADASALRASSGTAGTDADPASDVPDGILSNPDEAYRTEVRQAVIDAMLDHSASLGIGADEWLTIGARRNDVRPRLGLESNAQTFIIRVRGADLHAFRAGQLSREDAIRRVEVRVF